MDSHFQMASLLECPSFPNSVAWSEENLVAVASGSIITILNPASIAGPRGLIKLSINKPFPIGVVKEEDLFAPRLMPISLSCNTHLCARSVSWSPVGFASNSGCLLATCSIDGHVKIYRSPYCEYCVEWVEVIDVSEILLDFLVKIDFMEQNVSSDNFHQETTEKDCAPEPEDNHAITSPNMSARNVVKRKRKERCYVSTTENSFPLITASQYASRSAMLSSQIVAWSSVLKSDSRDSSSKKYAILAVGGKSGKISFWRFQQPECYTIEHGNLPVDVKLVGILQAHDAWITAISWEMLVNNSSESYLVLSTGSSNGSTKLWIVKGEDLIISSEVNFNCFQLLKEVVNVTHIPISTLSMAAPMKSPNKIVLGIGKGSGSLEAWICDIFLSKFQSIGIYNAHDQVVTGLSWAFSGCCLYSCSQDGSVRSWNLCMNTLDVFGSNPPKLQESKKVAQLSDPCLGLAPSPGNLMIAVVHTLDVYLLNQMYQARTQKAAVEFFWTGDQAVNNLLKGQLDYGSSILPEGDLSFWESNILWSLKQYQNIEKPLVVWDILAALLALKQTAPCFVEHLLLNWFSSWCSVLPPGFSLDKILFYVQNSLPKINSRQIHLLNIICRHLILSELKIEVPESGQPYDEDKLKLWNELLIYGEKEMRVRLVSFTLEAALFLASHVSEASASNRKWLPVGVAQMEQWVTINKEVVEDRLLSLVSRVGELGKRIKNVCDNQLKESCDLCSAIVPFESPETDVCKGTKSAHKLQRCSVSMKLCSFTNLPWFCTCCQRWATRLMPNAFFTMHDPLINFGYVIDSFTLLDHTKPLCPFCGIQLQRHAPNFLLAVNPV